MEIIEEYNLKRRISILEEQQKWYIERQQKIFSYGLISICELLYDRIVKNDEKIKELKKQINHNEL
jgi:hypothetical protein